MVTLQLTEWLPEMRSVTTSIHAYLDYPVGRIFRGCRDVLSLVHPQFLARQSVFYFTKVYSLEFKNAPSLRWCFRNSPSNSKPFFSRTRADARLKSKT